MQQELEDQRTQCVNAGQEAQAVIEARADKALETLEKDGKVALEIAESGVEAAQKAMDETTAGDDGEGGALRVELTKALAANTTLRGKMGTVTASEYYLLRHRLPRLVGCIQCWSFWCRRS